MLLPSIFDNNFFDNFFDDVFSRPSLFFNNSNIPQMNTDVCEYDDHFELKVELPGYSKDNIKANLKDGYLTIAAQRTESNDEKDSNGKYIRRERYAGQCQRRFYVGKNVTEEDIKASFENGILNITVPKVDSKDDDTKYIPIL